MKKRFVTLFAMGISLVVMSSAVAEEIAQPIPFHPGETARSADVNDNFERVYDQVNKVGRTINVDDTNKRVGIGTENPSSILHVKQDVGTPVVIIENGTAQDSSSILFDDAGTTQWTITKAYSAGTDSQNLYIKKADGSTVASIRQNGSFVIEGNFQIECPPGFASIENPQGKQLGCMQFDEQATARAWAGANHYCFDAYGGRLPTAAEMQISFTYGSLNDETDDWEWVADAVGIGGDYCIKSHNTIENVSQQDHDVMHAFRCWIPK